MRRRCWPLRRLPSLCSHPLLPSGGGNRRNTGRGCEPARRSLISVAVQKRFSLFKNSISLVLNTEISFKKSISFVKGKSDTLDIFDRNPRADSFPIPRSHGRVASGDGRVTATTTTRTLTSMSIIYTAKQINTKATWLGHSRICCSRIK